jgi:hypothetical protein
MKKRNEHSEKRPLIITPIQRSYFRRIQYTHYVKQELQGMRMNYMKHQPTNETTRNDTIKLRSVIQRLPLMKKEFKTFLSANMASSTLPFLLLLALTHREQDGKQTSPPTHFKTGFLKSTSSSRAYSLHCTLSTVGTRTITHEGQ